MKQIENKNFYDFYRPEEYLFNHTNRGYWKDDTGECGIEGALPRGIVCLLEDGPFQINVGNWIKSVDKNLLMALITNEFNLENEKVKLQEDNHWDI